MDARESGLFERSQRGREGRTLEPGRLGGGAGCGRRCPSLGVTGSSLWRAQSSRERQGLGARATVARSGFLFLASSKAPPLRQWLSSLLPFATGLLLASAVRCAGAARIPVTCHRCPRCSRESVTLGNSAPRACRSRALQLRTLQARGLIYLTRYCSALVYGGVGNGT